MLEAAVVNLFRELLLYTYTGGGARGQNLPLAGLYVFKLPPWSLRLLSRSLAPRNPTVPPTTPRHATPRTSAVLLWSTAWSRGTGPPSGIVS